MVRLLFDRQRTETQAYTIVWSSDNKVGSSEAVVAHLPSNLRQTNLFFVSVHFIFPRKWCKFATTWWSLKAIYALIYDIWYLIKKILGRLPYALAALWNSILAGISSVALLETLSVRGNLLVSYCPPFERTGSIWSFNILPLSRIYGYLQHVYLASIFLPFRFSHCVWNLV